MPATRIAVQFAALATTASVLFGVSQPPAYAETAAVVADFPAAPLSDDVDWASVQEAFGGADLHAVQGPTTFALGRIAERRGTSFDDLLDEIGEGAPDRSLAPKWVFDQAKENDYVIDGTPTVGSLAYFAPGTSASLAGPNVRTTGTKTYRSGHLAYVAAVNDDGTVKLEDYGPGAGYQNYDLPAASVTQFIHIGKTRPKGWITGAFEPSSPTAPRDLAQDPVLGDNYPVQQLLTEPSAAHLTARDMQQCGTFAEWWTVTKAGGDFTEYFRKTAFEKAKHHVGTEAGSAGRMDELYLDLGVKVDKSPAVGAIATWDPGDDLMGSPFGADGHAAVVSRVYRLNKADQEAADKLAESEHPNPRKLKKLLDRATAAPSDPKLSYVLLEDYNGFGGPLTYGQKLLRADLVKHYSHLAKSTLVKPVTTDDQFDRHLAGHPTLMSLLGSQTGTETTGDEVKRTYENGAVTFNTKTTRFSYELPPTVTPEQITAIQQDRAPAITPEPTARQRLEAQARRATEILAQTRQKYAGKKQSTFMTDTITALTTKLLELQSKLATTVS